MTWSNKNNIFSTFRIFLGHRNFLEEVRAARSSLTRCDRLMASSSSSSGLRWKYDVFINFRGEDTRRGFVSHLYRALRQKPLNTFIDTEELRKGDRLSELLTAIRESRLSIVVFSQNYASSTWCLKELVEILEYNDNKNQIVVPIFYEVDPSDIRKLKGSFAEAFDRHEGHSNANMEEVRSWRSALTRATNLSGWDSRNYDFDGLDDTEKDIFLDIACFFKGMKKDYATEILDGCGFHPHTRIRVLIDQALITVSGEGELAMHDSLEEMGREIVRQESIREPGRRSRLWSYEDVHHVLTQNSMFPEISEVVEKLSWLNLSESKIKELPSSVSNLTGLNHLVLVDCKELQSLPSSIRMKSLNTLNLSGCLSLEIFPEISEVMEELSWLDLSRSKIKELPSSINNLTGLNHLVLVDCKELKSLPSSIRMKSLNTLNLSGCSSLEMFPEISEVMEKLSWLNLSGSKIKELPSSINNLTGLNHLVLVDCKELKSLPSSICMKSLKTLNLSGYLSLEIFPEISEVMEELSWLDLSSNLTGLNHLVLVDGKELKSLPSSIRMKSLNTLNLSGCSSLEMFPEISEVMEKLSWLNLSGSKIKELPSSINNLTGLNHLVLVDCKELKSLPSSICMKSLNTLNLSGCLSLEIFPEISEVMEELSWLDLSRSKIKELPSSINNLTGLNHLVLVDGKELNSLPSSIRMKSLNTLNLSGCSSLEMFPEISEVMEKLSWLNLSGSKIKELPSSINNLTGLNHLVLVDCKELKSLPSSICMKSLKTLNLSGCLSLEIFPEISEVMEELSWLDLSSNLTGLSDLVLVDCKELKSLPSSIGFWGFWVHCADKHMDTKLCFEAISRVVAGKIVICDSGIRPRVQEGHEVKDAGAIVSQFKVAYVKVEPQTFNFTRSLKYDVFLNLRGLEAAASSSAISSLNKALDQKAVNTFIDAKELQKATTFRSSW
ncbi:hypothetical protein DVH24_024632 [Malus domestica]|uniref:TIR domain-containing protein n=1 Tax=Malus domestica TaxID=3750 RepID=A0A498JGZ2_MALDO|nr:hypothetical protein DVH24_024632 [Malus domestica]